MPRFLPVEERLKSRHFDQEITLRRVCGYLSFKLSLHATSVRSILRVLLLVPFASGFGFGQDPDAGPPPNGQAIFLRNCAKCHGEKGEGISAVVTIAGPNLQAEHDTGSAMTAMETGPSHMPSFVYVLSVPEMRAAADYVVNQLAVIPLTGGDLSEGGTLFRVYCATCHQTSARGGALAFTGINAPALTGKSAAIIAGAVRSGPGPMPAFPPSILTDKQLNSIVDYVEFIQHPPSPGGSPLKWYGSVAEGFAAWVSVFALVVITGWIERGGKG
jgi:ubiquinol-cytochrome c reductase cytochrome c subunit